MSGLFRVMNDDRGLQVDFMPLIHGVKSFNSLRARERRRSKWAEIRYGSRISAT